ncbi:MAG: HPF/RaiA family ribosome-associated protein [Syntrophorhabdus sp.]
MAILEVSFRDLEKNDSIERSIQDKMGKLEEMFPELNSARIALEQPQKHQRSGSPYRIRLHLTVPGKEYVVKRESGEGDMHVPINRVIADAFDAAERVLKDHSAKLRGKIKAPSEDYETGFVTRLLFSENYGFLSTREGKEVFFHKNSVLHHDFERLCIGTEVRFVTEEGEKGPQASTVQIIDKPGCNIPGEE